MTHKDKLVLDRDHIIQMLADPEFYNECVAFMPLKEVAEQSWAMCKEKQKPNCQKCDVQVFNCMIGVVDAFWIRMRTLAVDMRPGGFTGSLSLKAIKHYLEKRKHYTVDRVLLYYRRSTTQEGIGRIVIQ